MKGFSVIIIALSIVGVSLNSAAAVTVEHCNNINRLANAWNKVGNVTAGAEKAPDSETLTNAVAGLSVITLHSVMILKKGNPEEAAAGSDIETQFKALEKAKGASLEELTVKIRDLVASIDRLTDLCDKIAQ